MGYFFTTLLALVLNSCGVYIFHDASKAGCEPLVSSLVFLLAVCLLLWNLTLFPSGLRNLWRFGAMAVHFLLASFLMEHIMNDFWFPLETSINLLMPKIVEYESSVLRQFGWNSPGLLQFLNCDLAHVAVSYGMSLFFLMSVLHSTRIIDLRLLRCGKDIFIADCMHRMKKSIKKIKKTLTNALHSVKFSSNQDNEDYECDDNPCRRPQRRGSRRSGSRNRRR